MRLNSWNMHGVAYRCAYAGRIHSVADSGCEPASWVADRTFYVAADVLPPHADERDRQAQHQLLLRFDP